MTAHGAPIVGATKERSQAEASQKVDRPGPPNSPRQKNQRIRPAERLARDRDDAHFAKVGCFAQALGDPVALEWREIKAATRQDGFEQRSKATAARATAIVKEPALQPVDVIYS